MKPTWSYLSNPFDNVTKRSFKKMLIIATDFHDKLLNKISDPDINMLYTHYLPIFTTYKTAYDNLGAIAGIYRSNTMIVENLLAQLSSTKIRQWDIWIQNIYLDDTPEYTALLPERRSPFQTGAYELRISAIRKLRDNLVNYNALSNVYNDVVAFLGQIETARSNQQGKENDEQTLSMALENSRAEVAQAIQGAMGFLMWKYQNNMAMVETFFELQYYRSSSANSSTTSKSYTISAGGRLSLYNGQLNDQSNILVENTGNDVLYVFTTNDINATVPANSLVLGAGESASFYADEYADSSGYATLVVVNNSVNQGNMIVDKG